MSTTIRTTFRAGLLATGMLAGLAATAEAETIPASACQNNARNYVTVAPIENADGQLENTNWDGTCPITVAPNGATIKTFRVYYRDNDTNARDAVVHVSLIPVKIAQPI